MHAQHALPIPLHVTFWLASTFSLCFSILPPCGHATILLQQACPATVLVYSLDMALIRRCLAVWSCSLQLALATRATRGRAPAGVTLVVFSRLLGSGAGKEDAKIRRWFWKSIFERSTFFLTVFCRAREAKTS